MYDDTNFITHLLPQLNQEYMFIIDRNEMKKCVTRTHYSVPGDEILGM